MLRKDGDVFNKGLELKILHRGLIWRIFWCKNFKFFICLFSPVLGSVTFWCGSGSGSPDPYLWLIDLDPDPVPAPFFNDFKDVKKIFFFLITHPQVLVPYIIISLKIKFFFLILFCQALFHSAQDIYEKREGPGALCIMDPGGPKTWGFGSQILIRFLVMKRPKTKTVPGTSKTPGFHYNTEKHLTSWLVPTSFTS